MADITLKEAMLQKVDEVLNRKLPVLTETLTKMDAKLDKKFAEMDAKLDKRFAEMDAKLDGKFAEMLEMIRLWKMNRCADGVVDDLRVHKIPSTVSTNDLTLQLPNHKKGNIDAVVVDASGKDSSVEEVKKDFPMDAKSPKGIPKDITTTGVRVVDVAGYGDNIGITKGESTANFIMKNVRVMSNDVATVEVKNTVVEEPWVPSKPPDVDKSMHIASLGTTKATLVNNLGIPKKSGTNALQVGADVSRVSQIGDSFFSTYLVTADVSIVTQLWVGFYSTYLLVDKCEAPSKKLSDPPDKFVVHARRYSSTTLGIIATASLQGACVRGFGARIMTFIGGPSTEGAGVIVSKHLTYPIVEVFYKVIDRVVLVSYGPKNRFVYLQLTMGAEVRDTYMISEVLKPPPLPPDQKRYASDLKEVLGARLITVYTIYGLFNCARNVFDDMPAREGKRIVLCTIVLLAACLNAKEFAKFDEILKDLSVKSRFELGQVSYTMPFEVDASNAYIDSNQLQKDAVFFRKLIVAGAHMNEKLYDGLVVFHCNVLADGEGLRCSSFYGSCMVQFCISKSDESFYVIDIHMCGVPDACAEQRGQDVVGRAFLPKGPFCGDFTHFSNSDYSFHSLWVALGRSLGEDMIETNTCLTAAAVIVGTPNGYHQAESRMIGGMEKAKITPNHMRSAACKMSCNGVQLHGTLVELLENSITRMQLLYYDDIMLINYKHPFFRGCVTEIEVGNANKLLDEHFVLSLKVQSLLYECEDCDTCCWMVFSSVGGLAVVTPPKIKVAKLSGLQVFISYPTISFHDKVLLLDTLFTNNLVQSQQVDASATSKVLQRYGYHFYSKQEYEDAMTQYIFTIDHLEPSEDVTRKDKFDVETAIRACHATSYHPQAMYADKKVGRHVDPMNMFFHHSFRAYHLDKVKNLTPALKIQHTLMELHLSYFIVGFNRTLRTRFSREGRFVTGNMFIMCHSRDLIAKRIMCSW